MPELADWDQLRLILAIARAGTLAGGARRLGISHATAYRRLGRLEAELGETLFTRDRDGYVATVPGQRLVEAARTAEQEIRAAVAPAETTEAGLAGQLTIATTELLFEGVLAALFQRFQARYPKIALDMVIASHVENLAHRGVDIAIRAGNTPPDYLICRPVGRIAQAVYCTDEGNAGRWIMPGASTGYDALLRWHRDAGHVESSYFTVNTELAAYRAARAGLGAAVLPCYLAEADPQLVRHGPPIAELATDCWLLMHPTQRAAPLVTLFSKTIGVQLADALASAPAASD